MSYNVYTFLFFGVPVVSDSGWIDDLHDDVCEVIRTGCQSTNNPPMQDYVMIQSTYRHISQDRQMHIGSLQIPGNLGPLPNPLADPGLPARLALLGFLETHGLTVKPDGIYTGNDLFYREASWYLACRGS